MSSARSLFVMGMGRVSNIWPAAATGGDAGDAARCTVAAAAGADGAGDSDSGSSWGGNCCSCGCCCGDCGAECNVGECTMERLCFASGSGNGSDSGE